MGRRRGSDRVGPDELCLGYVSGVFGRNGETRVFLFNPGSDLFDAPRAVVLAGPEGERRETTLRIRPGAGRRLLGRLAGVNTPDGARSLIGWELIIPKASLPDPGEDTWYHHELLGLPVQTESGQELGRLVQIHDSGTVDCWVVRSPQGEVTLPALRELICRVERGVGITVTDDAVDPLPQP